jgi:signal transduction histidine kinase
MGSSRRATPVEGLNGTRSPVSWRRVLLCVIAGWLGLAVTYGALLYVQSSGAMPVVLSLRVALQNMAVPACLGLVVSLLVNRPQRLGLGAWVLVAVHLGLALAFAALWSVWVLLTAGAFGAGRTSRGVMLHSALPWHVVTGAMLYGLIVGAAYIWRSTLRERDLRVAAERAERLRAEAGLAALRAHINPHFLFNTLHSVCELVRTDPASAEEAIERLAELLRYSLRLDQHGIDTVRLHDEWQFTDGYLWLERMRMGPRLRVDAELDDTAMSCVVPAFTLQPIVENAIRHGLAPKPAGGTLVVRARELGDELVISVRDDGVGSSENGAAMGGGIGLRSIRQRLQARHGAAASVETVATPAGYTVTVRLPAESAE